MKTFGGPAFFLDRNDINTDEIIPAKYLTENSKQELKPHLLEDLIIDGKKFDILSNSELQNAGVIVSRENFGCGSSREHAVWVFEVNDINVVVAGSFARIFRQNMFNCGILAIELEDKDLDNLFSLGGNVDISVDIDKGLLKAASSDGSEPQQFQFTLNDFDKKLVLAGDGCSTLKRTIEMATIHQMHVIASLHPPGGNHSEHAADKRF